MNRQAGENRAQKGTRFVQPARTSQAALEYLTTYGWAILIIVAIVAVLYLLGILGGGPATQSRATPGSCQVARAGGPGSSAGIGLSGTCTGELPEYVAQFSGQGSYVSIPYSFFLYPQNQITVSVWVNTRYSDSSSWTNIVNTAGFDTNCDLGGYCLRWCCSTIYASFFNGAGTDYFATFSQSLLDDGKWHMLTETENGVAVSIYLDGNLEGSPVAFTGSLRGDANAITLGDDAGSGPTFYFQGSLANLQIYGTALPASGVKALYTKGIGAAPTQLQSLAGWWPLNGNPTDYSGNGDGGTANNIKYNSTWTSGYTAP